MNKFKVGDWVRCNIGKKDDRYFHGVRQITGWQGLACCVGGKYVYMPEDLELVCDFVKGQEIKISDFDEKCNCSSSYKAIFVSYEKHYDFHYLVEMTDHNGNSYLHSFKYARAIEQYKAYSEPKLDWINEQKNIKAKGIDGFYTIYGCEKLYNDWVILIRDNETNDEDIISLLQMFNYWEWEDNSPCGGLVEANNE